MWSILLVPSTTFVSHAGCTAWFRHSVGGGNASTAGMGVVMIPDVVTPVLHTWVSDNVGGGNVSTSGMGVVLLLEVVTPVWQG